MAQRYTAPLALTIIGSISIGIAAIASLWILGDIVLRRGWKTMMAIMIPVYVVNALYLWPITLWTYLNYGRPPKPSRQTGTKSTSHCHQPPHAAPGPEAVKASSDGDHGKVPDTTADHGASHTSHSVNGHDDAQHQHHDHEHAGGDNGESMKDSHVHGDHGCHGGERPLFATITIAVCHCGAGCVIGDIIGEWIVYGSGVSINGRALWPAYLIDFVWALALGILFQYYSIAPMANAYGPKTLLRAAKADFLSLMFFEIGLFGWMAIFQIAIFKWQLEMNTVTYWFMMQIGMFCGHWTGVPINYWLIKTNVKEPCA